MKRWKNPKQNSNEQWEKNRWNTNGKKSEKKRVKKTIHSICWAFNNVYVCAIIRKRIEITRVFLAFFLHDFFFLKWQNKWTGLRKSYMNVNVHFDVYIDKYSRYRTKRERDILYSNDTIYDWRRKRQLPFVCHRRKWNIQIYCAANNEILGKL